MTCTANGTIPTTLRVSPRTTIHVFAIEQSSYLLVHEGHALLVDCHSPFLRRMLEQRGLPLPEMILHTHVQPEHCREGDTFPEAIIRVPAGLEVLASDPHAWDQQAHTTWEHPEKWMETLGAEAYGIAGCITQYPPAVPLQLGPSVHPGQTIIWHGLTLEALALPGHGGPHALGYLVKEGDQTLGLFCGDLLRCPAHVVNLYDLEKAYGVTWLPDLPRVLHTAATCAAQFFPATGPILLDGPGAAETLASKIEAYLQALEWRSSEFIAETAPACPRLGRYCVVTEGIYQFAAPGNPILLIDKRGRGLMIDPGPCGFDHDASERLAAWDADLDLFEKEAGLKTIDLVLITHHHGDHFDLLPQVLRRYGSRVAAWDLVARVIQAPWDYPYCCMLPWYNVGVESVKVDDILCLSEPYYWHDVAITSVHLPGHSLCHAGYLLTFNGNRLAITGDTIQANGDAPTLDFIMGNHSVPGAEGNLAAFQTMCKHSVDLNLGGHGSRFTNCGALYQEAVRRIEHATPFLAALVMNGDFPRACCRPHFPRMDAFN